MPSSGQLPKPVLFKDGVNYDWHYGDKLAQQVRSFHDDLARQPRVEMTEAKRLNTKFMDELARRLKAEGYCSRLEYTGSSYEGVKVKKSENNTDLEFDIMIVNDVGNEITVEALDDHPGFVLLRVADPTSCSKVVREALDEDKIHVSPVKLAMNFMKSLQKCIKSFVEEQQTDDDFRYFKQRIKLKPHGPAIQMDVFQRPSPATSSDNDNREGPEPPKLFYSVDLVPTLEVSGPNGKEYYVAKPVRHPKHNTKRSQAVKYGRGEKKDEKHKPLDAEAATRLTTAWRRSFSVGEKKLLVDADGDNGCRKQVLRIMKYIRNSEPGLALLTSYHLKTVMFRLRDSLPAEAWKSDCLAERLMDMIKQLEMELGSGFMGHYFIPDVNLLDGIPRPTVDNMRRRFRALKNSEKKMMKKLGKGKLIKTQNPNKEVILAAQE